jgi:hypothetical protein
MRFANKKVLLAHLQRSSLLNSEGVFMCIIFNDNIIIMVLDVLSICKFVCPSVCMSGYLPIHSSFCLSVRSFVHLSMGLFTRLSKYWSVCQYFLCLSIYLYVCSYVHLSASLSICCVLFFCPSCTKRLAVTSNAIFLLTFLY